MFKKVLLGSMLLFIGCKSEDFTPSEDFVLEFIKENPEKSSIALIRNDTVVALHNGDKMMPLASTFKIIVAISYARMAAEGKINADEMIPVSELEKYYVRNTDGGAHQMWLDAVSARITDQKISIREISKGMIKYSSNANTEWLMLKLGLGNINAELNNLAVKNHESLYYIVSSLFVGKESFPGLTGSSLAEKLRLMSNADYLSAINTIHQKLQADPSYKTELGDMSTGIQKVWSDRLTASTVNEYAGIMQKINGRKYFRADMQKYLDEVMEFLLENPANAAWLEHTGMKGGSTAFVLTKALYATDKKGNKTELVYFWNNLSNEENKNLQSSMNDFELNILSNPAYVQKIRTEIPN